MIAAAAILTWGFDADEPDEAERMSAL